MLTKKRANIDIRYIEWAIIIISIVLFGISFIVQIYNMMLVASLLVLSGNIIFAMRDLKNRILFLFFSLAQFVFLLIRPLIDMVSGDEWWLKYWESAEQFAMVALFLTFISMYLGGNIAANIKTKTEAARLGKLNKVEHKYIKYIQIVAGTGYGITWLCHMVAGIEKVVFMRGKVYAEYYVSFESKLPYVIIVMSAMMLYFLCIFLATRPSKKISLIALGAYIISALPSLIIGIRNPIVLNCMFAFLYYFIRDVLGDEKKWIGKIEKTIMVIALPISVIFLGAYNYLRSAEQVTKNIGSILLDFFYSQGVTFEVLIIGHGAMPYLPERSFRNYTFGGIIDYIAHGSIAQKLWGAEAIPDGNSIFNAFQSNNFAHNMSYIAKGKEAYLNGEGFGSSYILETYVDFGYIGLVIFSFILGIILIYAMTWLRKNILTFTITLTALTTVFFAPRAEALGWIQFLIYIQFWLPVLGTLVGAVCLKWLVDWYRIKHK